jgi:hypothetical protein
MIFVKRLKYPSGRGTVGKLHEAQKLAIELDELMRSVFLDTGPIPIKCMIRLWVR